MIDLDLFLKTLQTHVNKNPFGLLEQTTIELINEHAKLLRDYAECERLVGRTTLEVKQLRELAQRLWRLLPELRTEYRERLEEEARTLGVEVGR